MARPGFITPEAVIEIVDPKAAGIERVIWSRAVAARDAGRSLAEAK